MTLNKFTLDEIQRRINKISKILDDDMSFEKMVRLHSELFVIKAIINEWEFNTDYKIQNWESKI